MEQFRDFELETSEGVFAGQRIIPIERVGCYIPGGNFPLPSTVLMTVLPAKIAGVKEIIICSPPKYSGSINPMTLVAADICGVKEIYKVGGPAAIAAMAIGTETIKKVDKIVGPGNAYVTEAKRLLYGCVGIDLLAGPSEILIIADDSADPKLVASDMLSEREHDENAAATLVTDSASLGARVEKEINIQAGRLETKIIAGKALKNMKIIVEKTIDDAIDVSNELAPEHVEIQVREPFRYLDSLRNYGSLFIGEYMPNVLGDYSVGTNHVLPTGKSARFSSGLSVKDFINLRTYQYATKDGYKKVANIARKLAEAEGLDAHKKSAEMRFDSP